MLYGKISGAVVCLLWLSGCGTYVPHMQEFWEAKSIDYPLLSAGGFLEFNIKRKVYCDIAQAIQDNNEILPKNWGVQVTLDLQVDETGSANASTSALIPLSVAESVSPNVGVTLSSESLREDQFGSYWDLSKLGGQKTCKASPGSSPLIGSDLGISQWLNDALLATYVIQSSSLGSDNEFKQDFISHHVRFVVKTAGNIGVDYKLVRFSSGSGPFLSGDRTRTHDLLITFGPKIKKESLNIALQAHADQQAGISVANSARIINSIPGIPY